MDLHMPQLDFDSSLQIFPSENRQMLTRFNEIAIQARVQMDAHKKAVGLSRVHMYESKCSLLLRDNRLFCS